MSDESRIKKISAAFLRQAFPIDLRIALLWLVIDILAIYLPVLNETLIRMILLLPGILFLPGYCIAAAVFPGYRDIDLLERVALSFGLSITVVPLIVFGLNFTPFGMRLEPAVIALTLFTFLMILVAHYRRSRLPSEEEWFLPPATIKRTALSPNFLVRPDHETEGRAIRHIRQVIKPDNVRNSCTRILDSLWNAVFPKEDSRVEHILTAVLIGAIIIAGLAAVYLVSVPKEGERFTEFFILGETQKVAGYPSLIRSGQNYPLYIGVGNHEYRDANYTIETWFVRSESDDMTTPSHLIAMDPGEHLSFTLAHNETYIIPYNLSIQNTTYNRVEFLLFKDTVYDLNVTGRDRINASDRELHLWITVR